MPSGLLYPPWIKLLSKWHFFRKWQEGGSLHWNGRSTFTYSKWYGICSKLWCTAGRGQKGSTLQDAPSPESPVLTGWNLRSLARLPSIFMICPWLFLQLPAPLLAHLLIIPEYACCFRFLTFFTCSSPHLECLSSIFLLDPVQRELLFTHQNSIKVSPPHWRPPGFL